MDIFWCCLDIFILNRIAPGWQWLWFVVLSHQSLWYGPRERILLTVTKDIKSGRRGRQDYYKMRQNNEIWNDECKVKAR